MCRFGISDASIIAGGMFVGLYVRGSSTTANPSTLANLVGVGCDSTDTVMQIYASGSAAQARTSLGANFPANTTSTDLYELILFAPPNGSNIQYQVTRLNTGDVASGTISAAANLPANTTWLCPAAYRNNAAVASAVAIDICTMVFESEI
jgi:hypothetical protein